MMWILYSVGLASLLVLINARFGYVVPEYTAPFTTALHQIGMWAGPINKFFDVDTLVFLATAVIGIEAILYTLRFALWLLGLYKPR